jgi:two-component system, OmpR family, sensor kinase
MTIRLRMALGLTALAAAILSLAGIATYQILRGSLLDEIERDVARRAAAFAAAPPRDLDVFTAPDVFLQVVDRRGEPVRRSANLEGRRLPLPPAARAGRVVEVHVDGRPLFEASAPLAGRGRIVVARSPITTYGALRELRRLLYVIVGLAVALAAGLAWFYARAALRPLERVVEAAAAVRESRDLSRRVAHHGPADEVGRLRDTFNSMLAELETAYERLDRSNARLRQFLADCSHEMRAPLTLILSNLDLLAKVGATDRAFRERALADVRAEADRMARMVSQLLILARADAGAQVTSEPVRMREVVLDAGRHGQRMARAVSFVPDASGALDDAVVVGNADYLRQLLLILLDNAFKYTAPPGEVRIETALEEGHARVTVSDTGSGIEPADLPRIFERFHRGANVDGVTGTGLGLAIARLVAEQHGGRIEVETVPGQGSRFSLVLPLTDPRQPTAAPQEATLTSPTDE